MKKKLLGILIWIVCLIMAYAVPVSAIEGTSYTYTISADQSKYIPTLDAYLPAGVYLSGIGLS